MTQVERLFEIASLDLESVRKTAGLIKAILVEASPGLMGKWWLVVDSTTANAPRINFFGIQVEVTSAQFKELMSLEPGTIEASELKMK